MLTKLLNIVVLMSCLAIIGCSGGPADPTNPDTGTGDPNTQGPTASFTIKKTALKATVDAAAVELVNPDNDTLQVRWDWTNDGTWDTNWSATKTAEYTYDADGTYTVRMEVRDSLDRTDSATKLFKIAKTNKTPKAVFAVNMVHGMTASADASSSTDEEDLIEDLKVRWDWDGDGNWDTDWSTTKTIQYTYSTSGEYTIKMQVKDLNDATAETSEKVLATPITIRSAFSVRCIPYLLKINFRIINNLTEKPVAITDLPALARSNFLISEDGSQIDLAETNQLLTQESRPMHLVLVLDFTGSMYDANGIVPMIDAAKAFIDSQPETTHICLWAFWERQGGFAEINDFTPCTADGKTAIKSNIDTFAAGTRDKGATQIWDLLYKILMAKFFDFDTGVNRAIAFLSDGHDTTSVKTVSDVINLAKKKGVNIFSMGLAFRAEEYPKDEPNLKLVAEETGGVYFTVTQVSDLSTVFNQMAEDLKCDWTLSYITLESSGTHTFSVKCNYLDGIATMTGKFPVDDYMKGDIETGMLSVKPAGESQGQTQYNLYAEYLPRNISTLKIRVTSPDAPVTLTFFEENALCLKSKGWTIAPDVAAGDAVPADGWYTISSATPFDYGSFGKIVKCTVGAVGLPTVLLELPALADQSVMYGTKKIVFEKGMGITLGVPSFISKIDTVAAHGTPKYADQPSANADQPVTVTGTGLTMSDCLAITTISNAGEQKLTVVYPKSAAADGKSLTFELPGTIATGHVGLLDDYQDKTFLLQIVPHITKYTASLTPGDPGKYTGTGFIEGRMTAVAGGITYADNGEGATDGIDVTGLNTYFLINIPSGNPTPVYVVTEGGTSVTLP